MCQSCSVFDKPHLLTSLIDFFTLFEQKYHRRDVRSNTLESHLDVEEVPKKNRIMISNIPLDTSEYAIEDLIKEFNQEPIFTNFIENKNERKCILELDNLDSMEKFVTKYNNHKISPETQLSVQIIEVPSRKPRLAHFKNRNDNKRGNRKPGRASFGSHYKNAKSSKKSKPTLEDLDKELDAYMNQDTKTN